MAQERCQCGCDFRKRLRGASVGVVGLVALWAHARFFGVAIALTVLGAVLVFLFTSRRRRPRLVYGSVVCLCIAVVIWSLTKAFPLRTPIGGMQFRGASLSSTLLEFARQRTEAPYWRFYIHGKDVADRPIHAEIPDGTRLGQALDIVLAEADCEWSWKWQKLDRTSLVPHCMVVDVWPRGAERQESDADAVFVLHDGVLP